MLPDILKHYIEDVESAVRILNDVYIERYEVEILTFERVNLRIRIRFAQGHLFELNEALIAKNESITQVERLSSLPQNKGSWHSAIVDYAGCRLTPVML